MKPRVRTCCMEVKLNLRCVRKVRVNSIPE
jgi:hypothetical protein